MTARMWLVYLVAMSSSCALWIVCGEALARLRAKSALLGGVGIAIFVIAMWLWVVWTIGYRVYFDYNPKPTIFAFFLENAVYMLKLLHTGTSATFQAIIMAAPIYLAVAMTYLTQAPAPAFPPRKQVLPLLGVEAIILAVCLFVPSRVSAIPPDLIGARTFAGGVGIWARGGEVPMLPRPTRKNLPPAPAEMHPDVLVIVNESVGRKQVFPWGPDGLKDTSVFHLLETHADHSVWFPKATTVAPVTNVAFPAILTGLGPESATASFKTAPLLWHDARAAGYTTALYSAQDYKYSFFGEYFLGDKSTTPDDFRTAREFGTPRTIDSGVDDALPATAAIDFIKAASPDKPFFVVIQFSGSHYPCWDPTNPSEVVDPFDDAARKTRCDHAITYIDAQFGRILEYLEEAGRLDRTLVISTSDHGETFLPARPKRPINFYEETMGVPLMVHVPPSVAAKNPALLSQLQKNRDTRVSNLDIYPTLLDLWGRWPLAAGDARPRLSGQSLFRPVADDRILASTARGGIYEPAVQGFALYHGNWKWLYEEKHGLALFDLANDPDEKADRGKDPPADEHAFFASEIHSHRPLMMALEANPKMKSF
ncbi:MAG TPA: sulfatase-like hydrolase/transferase [Polyangiaceae bacterium]|jgi:arylsulfatase A-like enzyme